MFCELLRVYMDSFFFFFERKQMRLLKVLFSCECAMHFVSVVCVFVEWVLPRLDWSLLLCVCVCVCVYYLKDGKMPNTIPSVLTVSCVPEFQAKSHEHLWTDSEAEAEEPFQATEFAHRNISECFWEHIMCVGLSTWVAKPNAASQPIQEPYGIPTVCSH